MKKIQSKTARELGALSKTEWCLKAAFMRFYVFLMERKISSWEIKIMSKITTLALFVVMVVACRGKNADVDAIIVPERSSVTVDLRCDSVGVGGQQCLFAQVPQID